MVSRNNTNHINDVWSEDTAVSHQSLARLQMSKTLSYVLFFYFYTQWRTR